MDAYPKRAAKVRLQYKMVPSSVERYKAAGNPSRKSP
jgi:hypothetical protein